MSIQEIVGEFRKRPAAVKAGVVLSSLLIVAGCGDSKGGIADCPPDYYLDHAPVKRSETLADMQFATFALRNRIRLSGQSGRNVVADDIEAKLRPAAEAIFRVDESASVLEDKTVLILGGVNTDTNLDEVGELVCSANGGEYFSTSEATEAYGSLYMAGIDVINNGPPTGVADAVQAK